MHFTQAGLLLRWLEWGGAESNGPLSVERAADADGAGLACAWTACSESGERQERTSGVRGAYALNKTKIFLATAAAAVVAVLAIGASAWAATVQVGPSGKTYASSAVGCAVNPATGVRSAVVEAGLFNPKKNVKATVAVNEATVATVTTARVVPDMPRIRSTLRA